ncbi:hypothetical protein B0I35DRAFT_398631 [Stachybotrys elegans]|uniref:chitinase n=1 Tax=Stachybotrys elegans TaxID=80388 RepID=A0A8K0SGL1_9HYPO|nr:hypothetical protein B0I35DRAFT_398631 [Stachybotrys elegans]
MAFFVKSTLLHSFFIILYHCSQTWAQSSSNGLDAPASRNSSILRLDQVWATSQAEDTNDFTCAPGRPCVNGACCGEDGWCGYGPDYCSDGCQSNCDATAECGRFASTPGQGCPLNVCCSRHGFCGTTSEFCSDGCQSNCETPSPGGSPSNPRDIIIGYWEAWNMDKPCGTMGPGEIPVHMLTHLFVSFGYVNDAWEITNMDGVDPEIFKTIGNVKARNPELKVVIALGGWAFSDPGPWRHIFPEMASSAANRAIFIRNLMGFMSEYGYDGVDWEYPGAEDRGGLEDDAENYTALLRELRAAINASGRDLIVTFTAPSSYWYLRHFDLPGMEAQVDWINLMSYDLHGVWDGDNPIGNQVLSHTNLTEIDLALDLFWRVGVQPSNVVLGLGFYGRSFELESSSCWKPGCSFRGPGAEGRCSRAPGILAYNEIMEILERTGGTPFFDEAAAAKYMVYNGHSWISFDDSETFELKIDYAAQMGLRGLMIWAIDLDTGSLDALSSVTGRSYIPGSNSPFGLVDLENLFPSDMLRPEDGPLNWGLVNFGSNANLGAVDPNETGFGFILVAGESHAMTSLKRRNGIPEPFIFLDCPNRVSMQPKNKVQMARVVCLSQDVAACFNVMKEGVEGTIVEMPDNVSIPYLECGRNLFARAIALEVSQDQTIPNVKGRRPPTSEVYDFSFDLDITRKRQDAGRVSVRVDYSNVNGYWNAAVDSPGAGSSSRRNQTSSARNSTRSKRYWSPLSSDWRDMYADADQLMEAGNSEDVRINEIISAPVYWDDVDRCTVDGEHYYKGFAAHVGGRMDLEFTYGFSMITSLENALEVQEAHGWLKVNGEADLSFSVGGIGEIDLDGSSHGNPAYTRNSRTRGKEHYIEAGPSGMAMSFKPYWNIDYMLAVFNESEGGSSDSSGPYFDGRLHARVIQDFGGYQINFPPRPEDENGSRNIDRRDNELSILDEHNIIYNIGGSGGRIALSSFFSFGLEVGLELFGERSRRVWDLADMTAHYRTTTHFSFEEPGLNPAEACVDTIVSTLGFQNYRIDDDDTLGWGESRALPYVINDRQRPNENSSCYIQRPSLGSDGGWPYGSEQGVDPNTYLSVPVGDEFGDHRNNQFKCDSCVQCGTEERNRDVCCGCANLNLMFPLFSDMPSCDGCNSLDLSDGGWPGGLDAFQEDQATSRNITDFDPEREGRVYGIATMSSKAVSACSRTGRFAFRLGGQGRYPAFPVNSAYPWDGIENGRWDTIPKYWGNTSLSCSNWQTTNLPQADTAWVNTPTGLREVRDVYQTEHVFEGQLIGDFFTFWLNRGHINNQSPMPSNPTPKLSCGTFLEQYLLRANTAFPWMLGPVRVPFIHLMLAELGSERHQNRLTIFKGRPNRMKGSLFSGNEPTSRTVYLRMDPDAQLTATKEFGMVFTYLNHPEVWQAFCSVYEAIYDLLGNWDDWWDANGSGFTPPSLQAEWRDYMETVLTSLVRRSRSTFDYQYVTGLATLASRGLATLPNLTFLFHWASNRLENRQLIRISGRCNNLGEINPPT